MNIDKLRSYKRMMEDKVRMDAYQDAIRQVCAQKVVCEIGVGLGPLSLMALHAGATRVYGIELDAEALTVATEVIRANGFGPDRFIPIVGLSTRVSLPEPVDVLLSETLDSMGIGENTHRYMADARTRLLKPTGVMLPAKLDCFAALASPQAYLDERGFWTEEMASHGLQYGSLLQHLRGVKHTIPIADAELHSEWQCWQKNDFAVQGAATPFATLAFEIARPGTLYGLALAFDAALCANVHLRTFPGDPTTHWLQGFAPFPQGPIQVDAGALVYVELHFGHGDQPSLAWQLRVASGAPVEVIEYMKQRLAEMATGEVR
jgi:type I protein arginine methyltransferase